MFALNVPWKSIGILAGVLALVIGFRVIIHQRDFARKDAVKAHAGLATAEASLAGFQGEMQKCADANHKMIDAARAADDLQRKREAAARDAIAHAQLESAKAAAAIRGAAIPQKCEEAVRWGNQQAALLGRW
jgi:hypothetical protein